MPVSVNGPADKRDKESVRSNICLVYRPPVAGSSFDELDTCISLLLQYILYLCSAVYFDWSQMGLSTNKAWFFLKSVFLYA